MQLKVKKEGKSITGSQFRTRLQTLSPPSLSHLLSLSLSLPPSLSPLSLSLCLVIGAFSNYSSKHNAELEQQYLATPSGNAILSRGQYTYAVDFVKMQQTNLVTEKSRPVRRIHGSKTSSSAASSTSSSATTPLTTSFDPVKTGVVPREVQISIEGKSPSVQLAAAKIQQLLNDSIVEQKVRCQHGMHIFASR